MRTAGVVLKRVLADAAAAHEPPPPSLLACACGALMNLPPYALPKGLAAPIAALLAPAFELGGRDFEGVSTLLAMVIAERGEHNDFAAAGGLGAAVDMAARLVPPAQLGGGGERRDPPKGLAKGAFVALSRVLMTALATGARLCDDGSAEGVGGGGNVIGAGAEAGDKLNLVMGALDADGNGTISRDEMLELVLAKGGDAEMVERIWARIDTNNDGEVTIDELADAWNIRRPILGEGQLPAVVAMLRVDHFKALAYNAASVWVLAIFPKLRAPLGAAGEPNRYKPRAASAHRAVVAALRTRVTSCRHRRGGGRAAARGRAATRRAARRHFRLPQPPRRRRRRHRHCRRRCCRRRPAPGARRPGEQRRGKNSIA